MGSAGRLRAALPWLGVVAGTIIGACGAGAGDSQFPAGNWKSAGSATYTNAAYTSSELYLDIDIAKDGSFSGTWGRYFCTVQAGAYGVSVYSCARTGSNRVSGNLGSNHEGNIDLNALGRSAFNWSAPAADELAFELPKNWQGNDGLLYRSRMTRDGKPKPVAPSSPSGNEGPLLSAVALYREFVKDDAAALKRYAGQTLVLEGRRGTLIPLSDGGAAIHIPDGYQPRALVLTFPDIGQVTGINEGAQFKFRCTVEHFDYQYLAMTKCAVVRE